MHTNESLLQSKNRIFSELSDRKRITKINQGGLISVNNTPEPECFLIHSGYMLLRRTEDKLVLSTLSAPALFGFNPFQELTGQIYLETVTDVRVEVIPASHFYQQINNKNLWQSLLNIMMSISAETFRSNSILSVRDSWSVIRTQLQNLVNEPSSIRCHTHIYDYIQQRTHLSRSGIIKYLTVLRKKGLVEMENGILQSIKPLPCSWRDGNTL